MGLLDRFRREESDTTRYPGHPITGSGQRRASHRSRGVRRAADAGQAWEDGDRERERTRGWNRSRR
ncbi:hypothetical protein [Streptomyces sp. NPDC050738]|uniref:hypothetical protein n=1 Tax=Streptomyces sp. NPDC050738 TaxID=3154744 RepID=UPI00343ED218